MEKITEIEISYKTLYNNKVKISNSEQCYCYLVNNWSENTIELLEEFKVLLFNRNNQVIGIYPLSKGGTIQTIVDVKLLFAVILKANAHSIILAHNHPSGHLKPSNADIKITNKIVKAGKLFDIATLDHLIISKISYYSLKDNNDF